MAKYRIILTNIWDDPDFQDASIPGKLIFLHLCTNHNTTESGIYPLSLKSISDHCTIPVDEVAELLQGGLKNIFYDFENRFVFVKNFRKYQPGGRPDLIKKSIMSDHFVSSNTFLWTIFIEAYPEFKEIIKETKPLPKDFQTVSQPIANGLQTDRQGLTKGLPTVEKHDQNQTVSQPIVNGLPTHTKNALLEERRGEESINREDNNKESLIDKSIKVDKSTSGVQNNGFSSCFTYEDYNNLETVYTNKVAFLITSFQRLHPSAPEIDTNNLSGRLANMWTRKHKDTGYILKVIWDSSSRSISGSHLDYIYQMLFKDTERKPVKKSKRDYKHMVCTSQDDINKIKASRE